MIKNYYQIKKIFIITKNLNNHKKRDTSCQDGDVLALTDKKDYYEGVTYYRGRIEGTRLKKRVPIEAIDEWRRDDRIRIWENYDETGEWLWARTSPNIS